MTTTQIKEFDPNRKYKVTLSDRFLDGSSKTTYSIANVQLDSDLKLPQVTRDARISPGFSSNDCNLTLVNASDGKESTFTGHKNATKTCALIYDHILGSFVLEQIDTQFAFTAGNSSSDSEEQSEAAILSALIESEGQPEEDNPFDWRHQLRRERTPTPDIDQFRLDASNSVVASPIASPAVHPRKPRARQASSPPGMSYDFEDEPSPAPVPDREEFELGGEEESDDDGGLQISYEGASKPKGFRGRVLTRKPEGRPMSLRSAANSQSPAISRQRSPESDADVDNMDLGSPVKAARSEEVEAEIDPDELEFEAALAGGNDEVDDMEAEFERAMEGDDEEDASAPAAPAYVAEDSSSESEEE